MKSLTAALTFVFAAAPALLGQTPANTSLGNVQGPHPFNVRDLVMMDRVSDPQLSPDGRYAAFTVRRTDYAANRVVIDGAFSADFHAGGELALAIGWLALLSGAVAWVLRRLLRSAA